MRRAFFILALLVAVLAATPATAQTPGHEADSAGAQGSGDEARTVVDQAAERAVPITFARSGRKVEIRLLSLRGGRLMEKEVVLTAFGRDWSDPTDVVQTSAVTKTTMTVPAVRVPTVFSVVDRAQRTVGELVAYPDRDVAWNQEPKAGGQDKPAKKITLYAVGAPGWFTEWAAAVGLPVKSVAEADLSPTPIDADGELPPVLLIVGLGGAWRSVEAMQTLATEKKASVLVLEARWFGPWAGEVAVEPRRMQGGLAEMASQKWLQPLEFSGHVSPHGGIVNRWAWITDADGLPLVEAVTQVSDSFHTAKADRPRLVVLSYLPWLRQLGRNESADAALLALLTSAARGSGPTLAGHPVRLIYPAREKIDAKERPILAAMQSAEPVAREGSKPDYQAPFIYVLDLRGKEPPAAEGKELSDRCRQAVEGQAMARLVILGDDPLLDGWKWLTLDREKKAAHVGDNAVVWLSDDELPPSAAQQVRLMMTFTEMGIPLVCTTKKETSDER